MYGLYAKSLTVASLALTSVVLAAADNSNHHLSPRIVNGSVAQANQFPSAVTVYNKRGPNILKCGGTILGSNYVVTAAHCVNRPDFNVTPQDLTIGYGSPTLASQTLVNATSLHVHPHYNVTSLENDIAVISVSESFSSGSAQPAKIDISKLQPNQTVYAAGWGATSQDVTANATTTLTYADLQIQDAQQCARYRNNFKSNNLDVICASNRQGQGVCFGDTGGPLYTSTVNTTTSATEYLLAGITSFGSTNNGTLELSCGNPDVESFFTHVAYYIPFLLQATQAPPQEIIYQYEWYITLYNAGFEVQNIINEISNSVSESSQLSSELESISSLESSLLESFETSLSSTGSQEEGGSSSSGIGAVGGNSTSSESSGSGSSGSEESSSEQSGSGAGATSGSSTSSESSGSESSSPGAGGGAIGGTSGSAGAGGSSSASGSASSSGSSNGSSGTSGGGAGGAGASGSSANGSSGVGGGSASGGNGSGSSASPTSSGNTGGGNGGSASARIVH